MRKLTILILLTLLALAACSSADPADASISGQVYFDENSDEDCDCECGIPDVRIMLYDGPCGGELLEVLHTDSEGFYTFDGLSAGSYCVFSDLDPQCNGYIATTRLSYSVDLEASQQAALDGFGYNLFVEEVQK